MGVNVKGAIMVSQPSHTHHLSAVVAQFSNSQIDINVDTVIMGPCVWKPEQLCSIAMRPNISAQTV